MSGKLFERLIDLKLPIPHAERSVLNALARWSNADGTSCYPSMDTIQELAQASRSTVLRCLESLRARGIIAIQRRKGRLGNRYRINIAALENGVNGQADLFTQRVLPSDSLARPKKRGFAARKSPMVKIKSPTVGLDSVRTPSVADATAARGAAEPPPTPPLSDRDRCYTEGVQAVIRLVPMQPGPAREFVGRMLARTGDNHARVLTIIRQCEELGVLDPRGWLMAKTGGNVVRGEFGQATRRQSRQDRNTANQLHSMRALGWTLPDEEDEFEGKTVEGIAL